MSKKDIMIFDVLEDGTIKTITGSMGGSVNHSNAEEFLREMQRNAGCTLAKVEKNFELDVAVFQQQHNKIKA